VKINILMAAVSGGKETRFHNGTGHISRLAVSTNKYHICSMSHDKISPFFMLLLTQQHVHLGQADMAPHMRKTSLNPGRVQSNSF
jgi:hypothetical protein